MTKKDDAELRRIDALIAEHIMHLEVIPISFDEFEYVTGIKSDGNRSVSSVPEYSASIEAALTVKDEIMESHASLWEDFLKNVNSFTAHKVTKNSKMEDIWRLCDPLDICLAALDAKKIPH